MLTLLGVLSICLCSCGVDETVYSFNEDRTVLAVKEPGGGILWRKRFQEQIHIDPIVRDIDRDGSFEVLVCTKSYDIRNRGYVFLFDHEGNFKWQHDLAGEVRDLSAAIFKVPFRRAGEEGDSGPHFLFIPEISKAKAANMDSGEEDEIILAMNAAHGFNPCLLCIIDANGTAKGAFWNPGALLDYETCELPSTGSRGIIAYGFNNHYSSSWEKQEGFYRYVIFLIDGEALMRSEAPVSFKAPEDGDEDLDECCLWYRVLPPYTSAFRSHGDYLSISGKGDPSGKGTLITLTTVAGYTFTLDEHGDILEFDFISDLEEQLDAEGKDVDAFKAELLQQTPFFRKE